jgi:hypothetical protein
VRVTHELVLRVRCPVDGAHDIYQVTVEASRLVKVEDILAAMGDVAKDAAFQEEITQRLAVALACTVTTVGHHSGVRTTCTA